MADLLQRFCGGTNPEVSTNYLHNFNLKGCVKFYGNAPIETRHFLFTLKYFRCLVELESESEILFENSRFEYFESRT